MNINSIRNKFDFLKVIISSNIDVPTIAETKLDDTFPTSQFMLDGFHSPFRYDRNRYGGGILVYVKHGVPAKELKEYQLPDDIECGFVEINIKKKKWLLANIYRPPSQGERYFFRELGKALDHFSTKFEDFILMGDFNTDDKGHGIL